MGEETDGVVESVSKMQEKIKALTGVDILTDSGAYKETYQILYEIGQVWNNLESLDRSALLELMAGKNRANTLAAILGNMEDLEGAYESALQAEGSALKENEAYLDSIQGRIDLFKNSLQTMWMNFIDSEVIKFIVDIGTGLIKLVDNVGLLKIAFAGLLTYFNASSKYQLDFASMLGLVDTKNVTKQVDEFTSILSTIKNVELTIDPSKINVAEVLDGMSKAAKNGQQSLIDYTATLGPGTDALKAYAASVQDGNYSLAGFQKFIEQHNANLQKSSIKAKAAAVGHKLLNAAISMGVTMLASFAIDLLVKGLDALIVTTEEAAEAAETAINKYKDAQESLDSQKETVDELAASYKKLSSGVNTFSNENIGLTTESYEEYLDVCNQIADMFPELISGYDAEGNAIIDLKGNVEALTDAYKEMAKAAWAEALTSEDKENIWKDYDNKLYKDEKQRWWGSFLPTGSKQEQQEILDFLDKLTNEDFSNLLNVSDSLNFWDGTAKGFTDVLSQLGYTGEYLDNGKLINFLDKYGIDFEEIAKQIEHGDIKLTDGINTLRSNISIALTNANSEISSAMNNIKQTVSAQMIWNPDYQKLDKQTQGVMNTIINNLNPDMIAQIGAGSIDEVVAILMSDLKDADKTIVSGIDDIQGNIAKAIADGDSAAFAKAKTEFANLIPDEWYGEGETIVIDENADAVTQYLQGIAKAIEEQSKNYEVKLQMQTEFESPIKLNELIAQYAGEYSDEIKAAFDGLNLGENAQIEDVYSQISAALGGLGDGDGRLRSDELVDLYDQWINADIPDSMDGWSADQIAAISALRSVMLLYGTDIDTVKSKLIDFGYVLPSLEDVGVFDLALESTQEFVSKFTNDVNTIKESWNSLNNKEMTKSDFIDLAMQYPELMNGVNLADNNWMVKAKTNLEDLYNTVFAGEDGFITALEAQKEAMEAQGLDTTQVDSFIAYAKQLQGMPLLEEVSVPTDTISALADAYEKHISVSETLNEATHDNIRISQEQGDAIKELIGSEEAYADCIDDTNGYVVKNTALLRKLVAQKKQEQKATINEAKAYSQLQYKNTVQQLQQVIKAMALEVKANGVVSDATLNTVGTLRSQLTALRQTIQQYALLELQLSDASNAYNEFEAAKTRDAELSYGDSMVEMLQVINDGFKTGKVGSEAFQTAVQALVPESVYKDIDDLNERMIAIHDYIDKNPIFADYFSIDEGQISINFDNMMAFIQDGLNDGLGAEFGAFTGTIDDFELADHIQSIEDLAKAYGITEAAALAMLSEFEKYDASWSNIITYLTTTPLDRNTNSATESLEEALVAQENFIRSGGDLNSQEYKDLVANVEAAEQKLNDATEAARRNAESYVQIETMYAALSGKITMTKDAAESLARSLGYVDENGNLTVTVNDDGTIQLTQDQLTTLKNKADEIESKPTIMDIQLQYDELDAQIEGLKNKDPEVLATFNITNEDEIDAKIAELTAEQQTISLTYDITATTAEQTEGTIEKLSTWETNGVTISIDAKVDEAKANVDEFQEDAERPLETTLTVNTVNGTTTVETDQPTGVVVNYETGPGYQAVMDDLAMLQAKVAVPITQTVTAEDNGTISTVYGDLTDLNAQQVEDKSFDVSDNNTIQPIHDKVVALDNKDIDDKNFDVVMDGYYTINNQLQNVINKLHQIDNIDATATVTVSTRKEGGGVVNGTAHVDGTAFKNGSWGAPKTETALVGELGPEMLVRNGRWTTIGENGAEFTQIKKGDIIFNHKQTEELLSKGYVTGRGKAYANGTFGNGGPAYYGLVGPYVGDNDVFEDGSSNWMDPWTNTSDTINNSASALGDAADALNNAADSLSNSSDDISDTTDGFKEVFDWIEVRLGELDETLSLLSAKLENAAYYNEKNNIIDSIIGVNNTKLANLQNGYEEYSEYANKLLTEVPEKYRDAAKNGAIAIEQFVGEADEATLEAINNYREWAQKAADLKQQAEEVITIIRDLAIQKFDNAYEAGDVRATVEDSQTEKLQNAVDYDEKRGLITSDEYYIAMMENSNKKIEYLTEARNAMQQELDKAVASGQIERGSNEWYELIDQMYQIDSAIDEATLEIEEFQNAINDIYWDNFDQLIDRIDYIKNDTQGLIDLMDDADMVITPETEGGWGADDVIFSNEGLATMGLYAQQMEIAEFTAQQYAEAIDDLNADYEAGKYSEDEYLEKLNELTSGQYDAIEAAKEAKEQIVNVQKARVEAIKEGIEKEIEAYSELIEKQKEQLNSEKDLYDFQKSTAKQQKTISDIKRRLAAIANDDSAAATAERRRLEAELAEEEANLDDMYYDRSVDNRNDALDREQEAFEKEKEAELEQWDKYLEDVEKIVADSLNIIQENASTIYQTLGTKAEEYDLTVSDAVMSPWADGKTAVGDYQSAIDGSMSSTMTQLGELKGKWQEVIDKMDEAGEFNVDNINTENENYAAAQPTNNETADSSTTTQSANSTSTTNQPTTSTSSSNLPSVGDTVTVKSSATHFGSKSGGAKMASFVPGGSYTVYEIQDGQVLIGKNGVYTGWVNQSDLQVNGSTSKATSSLAGSVSGISGTLSHSADGWYGSSGSDVKKLQQALVNLGYNIGTFDHNGIDGHYGVATQAAVYEFQKSPLYGGPIPANGMLDEATKKKFAIAGYALGTTGVKNNQLAWVDELGEELIIRPSNGRMTFLEKGTGVIPADLTSNLMEWGKLDPTNMLEQNRPQIGVSPSVVNNTTEINIDASVGELIHVEHLDGNNPAEITKIVDKAWDKRMKELNGFVRKYSR